MRPFINDPEGHQPHGPRFGRSYLEVVEPPAYVYQPPSAEQVQLADTLPKIAETADNFDIKVDDYQAWCELNWRMPHGTTESTERLSKKLQEEYEELKTAVFHQRQQETTDEVGDVLWCATALASNLNVSVKQSLSLLMDRYGHGTRYVDGGVPPWVRKAQDLTFDNKLSISGVDSLIEKGYEPQASPVMVVDEEEKISPEIAQLHIMDALDDVGVNCRHLVSIAEYNYEPNLYQSGQTQHREIAEHLIARIYLDLAFIVHHASNTSVSEAIRHNVLKLSNRVTDQMLDKSDSGHRSEEKGQ